jgi:hypothetical protein
MPLPKNQSAKAETNKTTIQNIGNCIPNRVCANLSPKTTPSYKLFSIIKNARPQIDDSLSKREAKEISKDNGNNSGKNTFKSYCQFLALFR